MEVRVKNKRINKDKKKNDKRKEQNHTREK